MWSTELGNGCVLAKIGQVPLYLVYDSVYTTLKSTLRISLLFFGTEQLPLRLSQIEPD